MRQRRHRTFVSVSYQRWTVTYLTSETRVGRQHGVVALRRGAGGGREQRCIGCDNGGAVVVVLCLGGRSAWYCVWAVVRRWYCVWAVGRRWHCVWAVGRRGIVSGRSVGVVLCLGDAVVDGIVSGRSVVDGIVSGRSVVDGIVWAVGRRWYCLGGRS